MTDSIKHCFSLKGPPKQQSLAGTLTLLLSLTVTVVTLTIAGILYFAISKSEYRQLEEKADAFMASIDDVLEIPLWNMDRGNIEKIARAYANDALFEHLEIRDNLDTLFFNYTRDRGAPVIRKSGQVYHGGRLVGYIDMAFTTQGLILSNQKIFLYGLGLLSIIIVSLTLVTGLFFKAVLKNLFGSS